MMLRLEQRLQASVSFGCPLRKTSLSTLSSQGSTLKGQHCTWRIFVCGRPLRLVNERGQSHSQAGRRLQIVQAVSTLEKQNAPSRPHSVGSISPVASPGTIAGGVVALGKFDALHIGHRALVEKASSMGAPWLLSFVGMAQVLGWQSRLPIVSPCDRGRVMNLWASDCGGSIPSEYAMDFAKVRSLSPSEFVRILAEDLGVQGVVAGENYRFGYKAAGSADDLVRLCADFGLASAIVGAVGLRSSRNLNGVSKPDNQVSSTRVRESLANGSLSDVEALLGRSHRLVANLQTGGGRQGLWERSPHVMLPTGSLLNQPPRDGTYACTAFLHREKAPLGSGPRGVADRGSGFGRVSMVGASWEEEREEYACGGAEVEIHGSGIEVTFEKPYAAEMLAEWTCLGLEFRS